MQDEDDEGFNSGPVRTQIFAQAKNVGCRVSRLRPSNSRVAQFRAGPTPGQCYISVDGYFGVRHSYLLRDWIGVGFAGEIVSWLCKLPCFLFILTIYTLWIFLLVKKSFKFYILYYTYILVKIKMRSFLYFPPIKSSSDTQHETRDIHPRYFPSIRRKRLCTNTPRLFFSIQRAQKPLLSRRPWRQGPVPSDAITALFDARPRFESNGIRKETKNNKIKNGIQRRPTIEEKGYPRS